MYRLSRRLIIHRRKSLLLTAEMVRKGHSLRMARDEKGGNPAK